MIKNVDTTSGEVTVNLNEEMLSKSKSSSQSSPQPNIALESTVHSLDSRKANKKQSAFIAFSKYTSIIPEKVCETFYYMFFLFSFIIFFVFGFEIFFFE